MKRRLLLTLGWLLVLGLAGFGLYQAWVEEAEPPMGACLVFVICAVLAIGMDAIARETRPRRKR